MFVLLALHLVVGTAIVATGRVLGRRAFAVAAVAPAAVLVWAATRWSGVVDGQPVTESFTWVSGLDITIDLRLDAFALLMVAIVSGIGLLICIYALGYFAPTTAATASRTTLPASPASPGCSRCSPGRCSASSSPTTCSCSSCSGS